MIEQEADDAGVGFVIVGNRDRCRRAREAREFSNRDEVEHGQVTPVRGQKRLQHRWVKGTMKKEELRNRIVTPAISAIRSCRLLLP